MPTLTVAIPTYRREQVLIDTIRQVQRQSPAADEILVVDQTLSHEPMTEVFLRTEAAAGRLRWIHQQPPNLPAARNRALSEAKSEIVLFLDDDIELPGTDFVDFHRRQFTDSDVWAVSGAVVNAWGPLPKIEAARAFAAGPMLRSNADVHLRGIPMLRGGHHSIRRDAAIRVGGFDEALVGSAFGEDFDLATRVGGEHILTTGGVAVLHLRAPAGGCRVTGDGPLPEWARSVSGLIMVLRHGRRFPQTRRPWLLVAVRGGPLRRENVLNPLRWPRAILGFARAIHEARRRAPPGSDIPVHKSAFTEVGLDAPQLRR